jgi:hypothetical protein
MTWRCRFSLVDDAVSSCARYLTFAQLKNEQINMRNRNARFSGFGGPTSKELIAQMRSDNC